MTLLDAQAIRQRAEAWISGDPDPVTRAEARELLAQEADEQLAERFGQGLEFGTAGLRGLLGAGENRMNRAVVMRASHGLAIAVLRLVPLAAGRGVVVGHDARTMSREFAESAARVLLGAGLRVHWFSDLVSTPLLSFAVGHLGAAAGVMITASHNPAAYNGYKVYWSNAAPIVPPHDEEIARAIDAAPPANRIACAASLADVEVVDDLVWARYIEGVARLTLAPHVRPVLRIVYTPLHGVGYPLARQAMAQAGFGEIIPVPEQVAPDPAFPTVPFPNPEERGVLDLALALARRENADLVLANDPDADRLAVAIKDGAGGFLQLSGNQVGVLLGHYLLTEGPQHGARAVVSTIVSSPMLGRMASDLGVHYEETLTGFKWIAARGLGLDAEGKRFVFGYEEALGYAIGDLVRDKDGVSAAVLFAELTAVRERRGQSVLAYLHELYRQFGLYVSAQRSVTFSGSEGARRIAVSMAQLRREPPHRLGDREVAQVRDYAEGARLPPSNVLAFELEGCTRIVIRPSGTEPKLKYYVDHREPVGAGEPMGRAEARATRVLEDILEAMDARLGVGSAQ